MANSPAHRFGQVIGDALEFMIEPVLAEFAKEHGLFLDKKGLRPLRKKKKKLSWTDSYSNQHDLDFVLERGGTPQKLGTPVAFIEAAWRRYTKHSRNKAQEIQGAILPLCDAYRMNAPFKGAILAGEFTKGALTQLKSLGFILAYFPYKTVLDAFATVGIDASSEESTSDKEFNVKIAAWKALSDAEKAKVAKKLGELNANEIAGFIAALHTTTMRTIKTVRVLPLHGTAVEYASVNDAISFISKYEEDGGTSPFVRYEVLIVYMNGDKISAEFAAKATTIEFLKSYAAEPAP